MSASWLNDAVFYEIYPQSFYDSNGDGIGDLNGITEKLDYVLSLGCNALWINPCFDSPFKDAGYDVRDFKKVAPRYGTNEDLYRLFQAAHEKGIHVLLDLVAGHTSEEHPWFRESQKAVRNEYSDRYIWTDFCFTGSSLPYIGGESERDGAYVLNFFKCQPALNYGFYQVTEPWQTRMNDLPAIATREALKDIMRFWLSHGCDGFRVDMAASLVKMDDAQKSGTRAVWRDVRRMLDLEFPDTVLLSEWSNPKLAIPSGFDMDFYLSERGNGYSTLVRDYVNHSNADYSYFRKDSGGSINRFLDQYLDWYADTKNKGYISLITCNHDTIRPSFNLDERELKLFYSFVFTMPGVPFLYYGDEIGMRYMKLPTKEGGYFRTGSRTPMQWNKRKNLGFSAADPGLLYLPVDPALDAPTVEAQEDNSASLLNQVRRVISLRHQEQDLQADGDFTVLCSEPEKPFVYRRGRLLLAVNPSGSEQYFGAEPTEKQVIYSVGETAYDGKTGRLCLGPQSFVILK